MRFLSLLRVLVGQSLGRQRLGRISEPEGEIRELDRVAEYDQVMSTQLVVAYAAGLMTLHRVAEAGTAEALDLACGPGHFTLCLARYLGLESVVGLDLSPDMVQTASRNARGSPLGSRCRFEVSDIRDLGRCGNASRDLVTFADAAHHMDDIDTVRGILREMDRIARPRGLVFLMDVARLKTRSLTERYVAALGHDYEARGLPHFLADFRNSMYAAWTPDELHAAIPRDSGRTWCHLTPRGVPSVQLVIGLPERRTRLHLRRGVPWTASDAPVPRPMRGEWRMLRWSLALGRCRRVPSSGEIGGRHPGA